MAKAEGGSAAVHEYLDSFVMSTVDTALAAQNAALAAESLGLGIVYNGAMRNKVQAVANILGLPEFSYVAFGMVVGYPNPATRGRLRAVHRTRSFFTAIATSRSELRTWLPTRLPSRYSAKNSG